ncbi:MAG: HD domain-containing protein [Acidobacteriota bacterium]|nr:bifunctional (p)ppGpp synthetase/guanosine-3',5'-bis(diphosphate) 3'-pyrophosphohydrolase [Acidobacteriota bacterium]MDQ3420621.1 HD domain-containing protein [Acidobacteriota bacterium]
MTFEPLTFRFSEALVLAADLHRHQARKGTAIPYISHLLAVTAVALEFGADENEAIAALLHDAIEDAPSQLGQEKAIVVRRLIEMKFGPSVLDLVESCTDADVQPKPPWLERKCAYIEAIAHKSPSAVLVSAADKLHNARAILRDLRTDGHKVWERFNKETTAVMIVGYYRGLVTAFQTRTSELPDGRLRPVVQELHDVVAMLEHESGVEGRWPPAARC